MKKQLTFTSIEIPVNQAGQLSGLSKSRGTLTPKYSHGLEEVYAKADEAAELIRSLLPNITHVLVESYEKLEEVYKEIMKVGSVAIDTETNVRGKEPEPLLDPIAGISVYCGGDSAYYVPINHEFYEHNLDTRDFVRRLSEQSYRKLKVIMHNAPFDVQVLYGYAQVKMKVFVDTLISARILNENEAIAALNPREMLRWSKILGKSYEDTENFFYWETGGNKRGYKLKLLWNKYCMKFAYSGDSYTDLFEKRKFGTFNPRRVFVYASLDAVMTWQLWKFQEANFNQASLAKIKNLLFQLEMPVQDLAIGMSIRGVNFDMKLNRELQLKYEKDLAIAQRELHSIMQPIIENAKTRISAKRYGLISIPINLSADKQLEVFFYDILRFRLSEGLQKDIIRKKSKTSKGDGPINPNSVGKEALKEFKTTYPEYKELVEKVEDYKKLDKIYTSFIIGYRDKVNPNTGRLHASWNTAGTDTGRVSSSYPNL